MPDVPIKDTCNARISQATHVPWRFLPSFSDFNVKVSILRSHALHDRPPKRLDPIIFTVLTHKAKSRKGGMNRERLGVRVWKSESLPLDCYCGLGIAVSPCSIAQATPISIPTSLCVPSGKIAQTFISTRSINSLDNAFAPSLNLQTNKSQPRPFIIFYWRISSFPFRDPCYERELRTYLGMEPPN